MHGVRNGATMAGEAACVEYGDSTMIMDMNCVLRVVNNSGTSWSKEFAVDPDIRARSREADVLRSFPAFAWETFFGPPATGSVPEPNTQRSHITTALPKMTFAWKSAGLT